jgi:serine protease DegQ
VSIIGAPPIDEIRVLRKLWLIFAQVCTLCLAALFVVSTLRPDLLPRAGGRGGNVVLLQETATPLTAERVASYADAAKKAMPAVVNIYTSKEMRQRNPVLDDPMLRRYFPDLADKLPRQRATSLGSGVIVSGEGFVLTNNHVIEGADDIQLVLADGRRLKARVRGADPESDLAVLKTEGDNLPAITFGNPESTHVGDVVLAIGNPFGFGNTVTMGIVSALGRSHLGINRFEDFIQTDAAINPGSSGGALVDTAGNLIGINSTIFSQSGGSLGIGFAIPVSLARAVLEQLIKDGEVTRGWLGIEPQELPAETAQGLAVDTGGVLIRSIVQNGPADRAGILAKDVVVEIDGKPTRDTPALLARIAELSPGSTSKVTVWRDRKPVSVDVTVGRRPKAQ